MLRSPESVMVPQKNASFEIITIREYFQMTRVHIHKMLFINLFSMIKKIKNIILLYLFSLFPYFLK